MTVSLVGLYVSDKVERAILEQQSAQQTTDAVNIDFIDRSSRSVETRGSSTDRVRLEEKARR